MLYQVLPIECVCVGSWHDHDGRCEAQVLGPGGTGGAAVALGQGETQAHTRWT